MSSPAVIQEYEDRIAAERAKAIRKYGQDALLPCGKPGYDILDYAINELVGFKRYAEMIENLHQLMLDTMPVNEIPGGRRTRELLHDGISLARQLDAFAARYAYDAIDLRRKLKKQGLQLGLTEAAA